nr:hypothetical protein [Tanacetum cinerariifolium]
MASLKQMTLGKDTSNPFMAGSLPKLNEDVIRRDLHLDDADGIECLPNEEIFTELARIVSKCQKDCVDRVQLFHGICCHLPCYRVEKGFSGVETPLFASMLVQPQQVDEEEKAEVPNAPTPPSLITTPLPPSADPIPTPHASPPQEQPSLPHDSTIPLLSTLIETCASLSQKVAELKYDKHTQALEILKLKKRVKKLEKKKRSKHSGLKRPRKVGTSQRVESSNDTVVGAQEVESFIDWSAIIDQVQKRHLDNIMKYQSLKKKPVRPIFEIEYKKVQTLFKPDKDVEEHKKKRVAEEILLQESFKRLKAVEVLGSESTQETPSNDPKEMSEKDV